MTAVMKRVVILGRGAAGKTTLARRLGEITRLPVIELDKLFWQPGLVPTSRDQWVAVQQKLVREERWIMDGDLGPYDALEPGFKPRIRLFFSTSRCFVVPGVLFVDRTNVPTFGAGFWHIDVKAGPSSWTRSRVMPTTQSSMSFAILKKSGAFSRM